MFIGEYAHSLDEKGRLSIPAKFRQFLQGGVVITHGFEGCLTLYAQTEWATLASKIAALSPFSKKNRDIARLMLAKAWAVELDGQGRIIVPESLRHHANISKRVVITGLYSRAEIWDESTWLNYKQVAEEHGGDIAESLANLNA